MVSILFVLWSTLHAAVAGTPVLYDGGDPGALTAAVSKRTGLPVSQLDAVPLSELLRAAPESIGDAVMRRCSGSASDMATVKAQVARAKAAWGKDNLQEASDHLDLAVAQLGCLQQLVEPAVGAEAFLLRGAIQLASGSPDDALGEIRTALAFDPAVEWGFGYPLEGQAMLDEERGADAPCQVGGMPVGAGTGPWLNGKSMGGGLSVRAGLHLAQYSDVAGIRSAWMVVGGDATLVLPASYRRPLLERMVEADGRSAVEALMDATIPDFEVGYVTWSGGLWLASRQDGRLSTTEVSPPIIEAPAEQDGGKKGKRKKKKK